MADPSLPPLTERNRTAATKYYDKNRAIVAERRVYKRVQKSGKMPTQATMAKFDLKLNEKGELVGFSENVLKPKTVVYIPAIKPAVATLVQPVEKLPKNEKRKTKWSELVLGISEPGEEFPSPDHTCYVFSKNVREP